jgi:4-amino-4-deoxy-L-arabinose transferase-like glycosyltransferase
MSEDTAYPVGRPGPGTSSLWPRGSPSVRLQERWLSWSIFLGVTLLAFVLYAWALSSNGYGNTYYAAAVRSMTMSWKNFFFAAFDPGGFITVDKPPVFLWVGALSARVFGYSSWSILLPSAFAGAASVSLLWLIVRRWFGLAAATISALVLALTPISVAVNRLNLPEPFLILALIGAAGCVMQSIESKRWWAWTAGAGFLVGVAFNTKMLGAWIPGPAFALAIVVAVPVISRVTVKETLTRLAVLAIVTFAVSASWMMVVDAWPASARPYVGGSEDNTELDLVLGYNGFGRVDGEDQGPGGGGNRPVVAGQPPNAGGGQAPRFDDGQRPNFNGPQTPTNPNGQAPGINPGQPPNGGQLPGADGGPGGGGGPLGNGFRAAGGIIAGVPGLFRMFDDANGGQIGWLLPFALGGALLALWSWRHDPVRRAFAVLFLGWVLLFGGIFSYAEGIYHSYYTAAMAPGIAALVGIGSVAAARAIRRHPGWVVAPIALAAITLLAQLDIAGRTPDFYGWLRPYAVVGVLAGAALLVMLAYRRLPAVAGVAVIVGALLLIPAGWSVSETTNTSLNASLPQAGPREGASGQTFGSEAFDDGTAQLAAWLEANNDPDATWELVTSSAQNASTLIAAYGIPVLPIGGFSGSDDTITVDEFADLVEAGEVRYVLASGGNGPGGAARGAGSAAGQIMTAAQAACEPVTDPALASGQTIYDCGAQADALRAAG